MKIKRLLFLLALFALLGVSLLNAQTNDTTAKLSEAEEEYNVPLCLDRKSVILR